MARILGLALVVVGVVVATFLFLGAVGLTLDNEEPAVESVHSTPAPDDEPPLNRGPAPRMLLP